MSLLFIFFAVIFIIILIARLASKTRPDREKLETSEKSGIYTVKKIEKEIEENMLEALISLLIEKGVFSEEEILSEVQSIIEAGKSKKH